MQEYPYNSAQILTDTVFLAYGGETGTSTSAQRNAAYFIAEKQMTEHLDTFLLPTTVTGTYFQPTHPNPLVTDYGHVNGILGVVIYSADLIACELTGHDGCGIIRNDTYGYLDIGCIFSTCACGWTTPYNIQVAYNAGFPTGTSMQPDMLLALTMAAQINLNEMDNHTMHNEGAYDIGVQQFSSQGYSEQRVKLGRNAFGSSAAAQKIANLVKGYVRRPGLRFH
jgi:hypothetical protein